MKTKRTLLGFVTLFLVIMAGLVQANSPIPPSFEPKSTLLVPEETRQSLENNPTQSAMPHAGLLHTGSWASRVADHGKGLGLGLLVGGGVAIGLVVVASVVVAGPVLLAIGIGALVAGGIYGLMTGAARFNVVDAAVQSLIGGVSAGVGWWLGAGGLLAGRALMLGRAAVNVAAGGLAGMASYLVQTPDPNLHGAGAAFGWGAATAGAFLGLGALAGKFQGAIRPGLGRLFGGGRPPGVSSALYREAAATVEYELVAAEPAMAESTASVLERAASASEVAAPQAGKDATPAAARMGTYRELRAAKAKDGHHIIQDAAAQKIPGYDKYDAPVVQLKGPPTDRTSPHYLATLAQKASGGGNYAAERAIAEKSLRAAGLSEADIKRALALADDYFRGLGVTDQTPLRIPGDRAR